MFEKIHGNSKFSGETTMFFSCLEFEEFFWEPNCNRKTPLQWNLPRYDPELSAMFFSLDFRRIVFGTLFPWAGKPARGGERVKERISKRKNILWHTFFSYCCNCISAIVQIIISYLYITEVWLELFTHQFSQLITQELFVLTGVPLFLTVQ